MPADENRKRVGITVDMRAQQCCIVEGCIVERCIVEAIVLRLALDQASTSTS